MGWTAATPNPDYQVRIWPFLSSTEAENTEMDSVSWLAAAASRAAGEIHRELQVCCTRLLIFPAV
ncbi:MAG: hypothetical protein JWQ78_2114 [Sediminibacterium sp.]|nr:hypothetical protein [Sediminibacterium sp.]